MSDSYFGNIPDSAAPDVCPLGQTEYTDEELQAVFANSISSDTMTPDEGSGRIPLAQIQQRYQSLISSGIIKPAPQITVGAGTQNVTTETDVLQQQTQDAELYNKFKDEYCFYEQRYKYALRKFLESATSRVSTDNANAQKYLGFTSKLNKRLNSLIEIMNYAASMRVSTTNSYVSAINNLNRDIENRRSGLQNVADIINKNNATVVVQKEMVNFTSEKNRYMTNQISVWAALNVLALATIFYVYRSA